MYKRHQLEELSEHTAIVYHPLGYHPTRVRMRIFFDRARIYRIFACARSTVMKTAGPLLQLALVASLSSFRGVLLITYGSICMAGIWSIVDL